MKDAPNFHSAAQVPIDHPLFGAQVFKFLSRKQRRGVFREKDEMKKILSEEYEGLSKWLEKAQIQESCSVRNVLKTRRLANLLIDDRGELNVSLLPKASAYLSEKMCSAGPQRQYDTKRHQHILRVLTLLQEDKTLVSLIKKIGKPLSHPQADQIIRDTLQLPANTPITDAYARRAVLSAWLCYLRQSVGSCFATAPAILVHDEQPELFLSDLNELLSTGRLTRTFEGKEYAVPLSPSWGMGDLRKPFLLFLDESIEEFPIWYSPGLIVALEAASVISASQSLKQKIRQTKTRIFELIDSWKKQKQTTLWISIEKILRILLLKHHKITEQDVHDYENRPRGILQGNLLMQIPSIGKASGGKGEACASFLFHFELAKNAFKALADNALLKAWEFTVASFAEIKHDFNRWNLYSSLGLNPEEPGGIGSCIYRAVKEKLEECNQKVQDIQAEYEQAFHHLKYLEARNRQVSTEKELRWVNAEYQAKANEFYSLQEIRDNTHKKARQFAELFNTLIDLYDSKFPDYFQEIYDADMHDVISGPYDDSPAGFRLLYKHGRSNTSQWTRIYNPNEFIDALASFFVATEADLAADPRLKGIEKDFSEIVTAIANHIKTQDFLESAFYRMAKAHHTRAVENPLENLDKIEKKPWVYTSGGVMNTLVSCYYRRSQKPKEVSRWVENETELLVFLLDTMKQIPYHQTEEYLKLPSKTMLMHSPTHAFLFQPGLELFRKGWTTETFTYTWVRDHIIRPHQEYIESVNLEEDAIESLLTELMGKIPKSYRYGFRKAFPSRLHRMKPYEFRELALNTIMKTPFLRSLSKILPISEEIDSMLYSLLPFFSAYELKERLQNIMRYLQKKNPDKIPKAFPGHTTEIFDQLAHSLSNHTLSHAKALRDIAKAVFCLAFEKTLFSFDCHFQICSAMQSLGYAMPPPIVFADTNWVKDEFGFVANPGTQKLELWRIDYTGSKGAPITSWKQWLDGTRQDPKWGVYVAPHEYTP